MKEKLMNTLGAAGSVLWFIGSAFVYILPFVMIGAPFLANLLFFGIMQIFPPASFVFWIWGLVCAINGVQDFFAIAYYVLFVVVFLPFFISLVLDLVKKVKK